MIEHLEPELSEWLLIEYSHAAKIADRGNLMITNVRRTGDLRRLSKIAVAHKKRVFEIFNREKLIVLDPFARSSLSTADTEGKSAVVIGGILGDDPPRGRTEKMLTRFSSGAAVRNIGPHQFSIDGAVYMAKQVWSGIPLERIPVKVGLELELKQGHSVVLPFAYPLVGTKPLISKRLIPYLKKPWKSSGTGSIKSLG